MMHPNEDEFVRAMKSQPASEADLRAKHRELHNQFADECGAVYDIHLMVVTSSLEVGCPHTGWR